ncbi:MAG: hypothetical protein JSV76_01965 [Candidatus Bathyarchaeota archaeon]|nr:MAG: hypothetical protein JSV76_01965 [Candidatus Bathyarchaeota archaeon]
MKSQKWMLDIEKCIGLDDSIRETYEGWLNGEYVYMVFTGKRIIIIEEPSVGVQKTRVSLNLPYNRIKEVSLEKPDIVFSIGLAFTDHSGFKRVFISEYESAQVIENKLRALIEHSLSSSKLEHSPHM